MKAIRTPKNRHAGIIRLILINKHELRYLKRLLDAFRIKRATLIARGVALMPDDPSELHQRILQVRESLFHLVLMYDKATVTPNLHERAQLLGVCHIALKNHRAAIVGHH